MQHPFKAIEPELRQRLSVLKLTREAETTRRAEQLVAPKILNRFRPVYAELLIPIVWMVCSFERESGMDFTRSPAQGDRWDRISKNVPRGVGPFTSFEASAEWSYEHDGINKNSSPWDLAYACYAWERFNGFGPRDHGRVSGYIFSGTDQYDPPAGKGGKYVSDGKWNPSAVDQQLGCVALALEMIRLDPSLAFGEPIMPKPIEPPIPIPVTPTPDGFAQALQVQQCLNHLIMGHELAGVDPLTEDGNYGRRTRNAVRAFQKMAKLDQDGIAGPLTKMALEDYVKG